MTTYAGEVRIKTRLDAAGINSGLSKVTAMMGKLAVVVGVAFSAQAIINFSKAAVEAASKSETAWAGLGFVLDANNRSLTEAKGFLQDYTSDGLVPMTDAIKAYQNMVMRGYDTAQIEDMLRIMKDSAAFGRQGQFSMGEAIEKATQGLRMENSLLTDSVGIQTNVARMWDEYARSIGTTTNALTLAQKRQAEYNGFMKEGGIFAGAAAKYANTYAGRVSQLGTAFYNLRVAVGNAIIPVLNQIIPVITKVINWFTRLFNIVGRVMNLLFGTNVSMNDTAQGAQDAADATGDMADNLEEANKAAKGSLAAFDKLNVLSQPAEGGGAPGEGGGGGMPMPVPDTEPTTGALDELEARIQAFVTRVREFFAPLGEAFGRLGEALGKVGKAVKRAFERFFPGGIDFGPFIALVRDGVIFIIDLLAKAIEGFANWINENPDAFNVLLVIFAGLAIAATAVYAPALLVIAAVVALLAALGWLANNWDLVKEKASEAWEKIKEVWGVIADWFNEHVVEPLKETWGAIEQRLDKFRAFFAEKIVEPLKEKFGNLVEKWQEFAAVVKEKIIDPLVGWFQDWLLPKIQAVLDGIGTAFDIAFAWWRGLFTGVFDAIVGVIEGALQIIGSVIGMIIDVIAGIITFLTGVFTGDWDKAWQGIKDIVTGIWEGISGVIKGVINGIIGFINGMINGIVSGINNVIRVLNKLHFDIPDWIPGLGGNSFGFNIATISAPQIPMLATGAVIPANAPFAAILGDQKSGRNIEAPEGLLRQIIQDELRGMNSQPQTIHNVLKLDGRVVYESWDRESRRIGGSMVTKAGAA